MKDAAARFERDLAASLDGRPLPPEADAAALRIASRLADADFAADSRVKESLRARLLARPRRPALSRRPPFLWRLPAGLAGALAAAAIVLLLLRPRAPAPSAPVIPAPATPVARVSLTPAATTGRLRVQRIETSAAGVFVSLPAGSPFEVRRPLSGISPFMTVTGRKTHTAHGRAMVWKLPHATYLLEDRPVRLDEIFTRPTL